MKNNNKKSSKIKNYLNAISKWIKKHFKYLLFGLVVFLYLFSCFAIYCKKNKETALAYKYETSENYILEFSSVNVGYSGLNNALYYGYSMPFYLVPKYDSVDLIISNTSTNDYITYSIFLDENSNIYSQTLTRFYITYYTSTYSTINIANPDTKVTLYFDYDTFNLEYNPRLFFETIQLDIYRVYIYVSPTNSKLEYTVCNSDGLVLIGVTFENLKIAGNTINRTMYFNYFYTVNAVTSEQANFYIDYGYDLGYEDGLRTTWDDVSPFQVVINGALDFLDTNLFGNFSIMDLIKVGGGALLLIIMLKFFMGG